MIKFNLTPTTKQALNDLENTLISIKDKAIIYNEKIRNHPCFEEIIPYNPISLKACLIMQILYKNPDLTAKEITKYAINNTIENINIFSLILEEYTDLNLDTSLYYLMSQPQKFIDSSIKFLEENDLILKTKTIKISFFQDKPIIYDETNN